MTKRRSLSTLSTIHNPQHLGERYMSIWTDVPRPIGSTDGCLPLSDLIEAIRDQLGGRRLDQKAEKQPDIICEWFRYTQIRESCLRYWLQQTPSRPRCTAQDQSSLLNLPTPRLRATFHDALHRGGTHPGNIADL